jgi:hypothetical protein
LMAFVVLVVLAAIGLRAVLAGGAPGPDRPAHAPAAGRSPSVSR